MFEAIYIKNHIYCSFKLNFWPTAQTHKTINCLNYIIAMTNTFIEPSIYYIFHIDKTFGA